MRAGPGPVQWEPGRPVADDIALERAIGQGGMGLVYAARNVITGQRLAVKRVRPDRLPETGAAKERFYRELITWIDLPQHPNLLPCLFYRSVGAGELAIFTEYVEEGALSDWIRDGRVGSLEAVLDIGIQLAWGLAAIHEHGLIHQDVKPGNVLMAPGRVPRLSDFGLARARGVSEESRPGAAPADPLVTWRGMTRAYCSPEQERQARLGPETDIYSWAATMVHLVVGEMCWRTGSELPQVVASLLGPGAARATQVAVPAGFAKILAQCLLADPQARPRLQVVAAQLCAIWQAEFTTPYLRAQAGSRREAGGPDIPLCYRKLEFGRATIGPLYWRIRAGTLGLGDNTLWKAETEAQTGRAKLASDLEQYAKFRRSFEAAACERADLLPWLARLQLEIALAQEEAGDITGALSSAKAAVETWQRCLAEGGEEELKVEVAQAYRAQGYLLGQAGKRKDAADAFRAALKLLPEGYSLLVVDTLVNLGNVCSDLGQLAEALQSYQQSLAATREWQLGPLAQCTVAGIHHEMAGAYRRQGRLPQALAEVEQCIQLLTYLPEGEDRWLVAEMLVLNLGIAHYLKGTILTDADRHDEAIAAYDRARELLREGGEHLTFQAMATRALMSKALSLDGAGRWPEAVEALEQVIEQRRKWVEELGRSEFADELARAYRNKAAILSRHGQAQQALETKLQAYGLYANIYNTQGRLELRAELVGLAGELGEDFWKMGAKEEARKLIGTAMATLEQLCEETRATDPDLFHKYRSQLATKYYQLSYMADEFPGLKGELLDAALGQAAALMQEGASGEAVLVFISAAVDKATMSLTGDEAARAEETFALLDEALYLAEEMLRQASSQGVRPRAEFLAALLRAAGVKAALLTAAEPAAAVRVFDRALSFVHAADFRALDSEGVHKLAMVWWGKGRAHRACGEAGAAVQSTTQAYAIWRELIAGHEALTFLPQAAHMMTDYIWWLKSVGEMGQARATAKELVDFMSWLAERTGLADLAAGAREYRKGLAEFLTPRQ